jgi:hypothetical protein
VLTLLLRNTQNNFAFACCCVCCAKAWLAVGKPSHSAAELLFYIKAALQQRLGFFILKNPSNAQVLLRRRRNHTPALLKYEPLGEFRFKRVACNATQSEHERKRIQILAQGIGHEALAEVYADASAIKA